MTRYALLLRGINLGPSRRIAMAELRELLTDEGFGNVATLLQSGNALLDTALPRDRLAAAVEGAIERRFGMAVEVIVRDRPELEAVIAHDPLADVAHDGSRYAVTFLAAPLTRPLEELLAGVDPVDDRIAATGTEIYVWCPHGLSRSPLMTALGKLKGTPTGTVRNWNTVRKLLAMV